MTFAMFLLALALGCAPQLASAAAASGPAVVLGRVVDAGTGRPIAGAIVTLFGSAAAPRSVRGLPSTAAPRVMTNASGQFVARGLRRGTLFFVVTKGGYVDAALGQQRPGGSGQPLPIADGLRITNLEIRMWRHAVIAGTVTDEAGEPIVGARVQAYLRTFVAGRPRLMTDRSASTDDRGAYRLPQLMPGSYQIAVVSTQVAMPTGAIDALLQRTVPDARRNELARDAGAIGAAIAPAGTQFSMTAGTNTISLQPGTATARAAQDGSFVVYPTVFFPSAATASQGVAVTVKSGQERSNVDLQMWPARARRVSGAILSPSGAAEHIPIRLVPAGEDLLPGLATATTMSDAAGVFSFPAVPPGQYVLHVLRTPRVPETADDANRTTVVRSGSIAVSTSATPSPGPVVPPPIPADATLYAQVPLNVGDADISGLAVPLRAAPRVAGRVEFDGSGERPDALTLANVRVFLDPADGSKLPEGLGFVTGRIDSAGQFITYGVPPGKYFVRVSGLSDWFFKSALYEGRDLADTPLELASGAVSGVVLTFTDRPSGFTGAVRAGAKPDGAAVVLAFPADDTLWSANGSAPRRIRTARAAEDGTYVFPVLPPGEYYLIALREDVMDAFQDPAFLQSIAPSATRVRLLEGDRRTQDLRTVSLR